MFEHLLELFFHAKVGALAGLILVGTTGALITATASANGVTTITLTQASASPSANNQVQNPTASPTASPATALNTTPATLLTQTTAPVTQTTAPVCDPAKAAAASDALKTVNTAYTQYRADLKGMRKDAKSDAAKTLLENTGELLKDLRQNAVEAIHATAPCSNDDKNVDEQNGAMNDDKTDANNETTDVNDEKDADEQGNKDGDHQNGKDDSTTTTTATLPTTPTVTPATADAKTIADNAVAAMKLAFDTATSQFAAANADTTPASPKPAKSPKSGDKGGDHHD